MYYPNATESISNSMVAIKAGYNESQLDSANRRATGSAIIPFNNYWQEVLDNVHRIKMGDGHFVFKLAATMNQVAGGSGRYTVDQVKQLLAYYDPATKAWLNGALHGLGYSINAVIPDPILRTLAQLHEYVLSPFHTENERFVVEAAGQLLLAELGGTALRSALISGANKSNMLLKAAPTIELLEVGEGVVTNPSSMLTKFEYKPPTFELVEVGESTATKSLQQAEIGRFAAEHNWPNLEEAVGHLPEGYSLHKPAKGDNTIGLVFKDGLHDTVTIKKAKLDAKYPTQHVDYVSYMKDGKYIASNGDFLYESNSNIMRQDHKTGRVTMLPKEEMERLGIKKPEFHPDVHIPLDEFLKKWGKK